MNLITLCTLCLLGQNLDPNGPYLGKKSSPVTYDVDLSAVVTPPYHTKTLKVWMPLPPSDAIQTVEEKEITSFPMSVKPRIETEPVFGNKFAYFEFDHPEGAQMIRHRFRVTTHEVRWNVDPAQVQRVESWPSAFAPYLRSDQCVQLSPELVKTVTTAVPKRTGPAQDVASVIAWVNQSMKYDHVNASLKASSEHALTQKMGHCSDYHGLCAAFGRAMGYPTRVVYGINPFPKNSPSHCKLEVFLPPYGWVPFDVSETQRVVAAIEKDGTLSAEKKAELVKKANDRLNSGFRDNTWFLQTRGADYDLAPPASKKAAVVRTIYAEADGVAFAEPDPANPRQREFGWMTLHDYKADRVVEYPFKGWKSLMSD